MLITNGILITWETPNRILENQAVRIEGNKIVEIGPQSEMIERYPQEERLDAEGQYVMPGNICAHTHFYGAYARGMGIPGEAPADFPQILNKLWWPLDKSLNKEAVRYSALVCLADAIQHGTTTLIDHHASPFAIEGSLDEIARAVDEAGVRASLCYEVTDRDGKARAEAGIAENARFIDYVRRNRPAGGRLAAHFGLHASLTLTEETLDACRAACPDDVGFHVHVAEHPADEYDSLMKTGLRVVDRLRQHHILGPKTIAAHAVHIDMQEALLLAEYHTWVSYQPRSNMNNAVGISPVESFMRAGIRVCLGNDGFSNAMWEEWKTAYLVHKVWNHDPRRMSGTTVVEMAVYNNAALATQVFEDGQLGVLAPGAQADLIFVDYHPYTPLTAGNLPWHILFGFHESMVTTTMVAGRVLMHRRELTTLDVELIARRARELAPVVWEKYNQNMIGVS